MDGPTISIARLWNTGVCQEIARGQTHAWSDFSLVLLSTATYGLFAVLLNHFTSRLKNNKWKYTNIRVFVYRQFTTKLRSMFFLMIGASIPSPTPEVAEMALTVFVPPLILTEASEWIPSSVELKVLFPFTMLIAPAATRVFGWL